MHVRTKNFKKWFGDWENDPANTSKVVDENGEPLVVYRNAEKRFNIERENAFFTDNKEYADGFEYGVTSAYFLNIRNPEDLSGRDEEGFPSKGGLHSDLTNRILKNNPNIDGIIGHDAIFDPEHVNWKGKEYVTRNPNQAKSATYNNGEYSQENNDTQMFVVGEKGARSMDEAEEVTTRMDNLSIANDMEKSGKDALTIKAATGWERGADGKWRYETEDLKLSEQITKQLSGRSLLDYHYHDYQEKVNYSKEDFDEMLDNGFEWEPWIKKEYIPKTFKLADIVNQDKAFNTLLEAYPTLKDLTVIIDSHKGNIFSFIEKGGYDNENNTLVINQSNPVEFTSVLNHELQHIIQYLEGFAYGGNMSQFENHPEVIKQKEVVKNLSEKFAKARKEREIGKISLEDYYNIYDAFHEEKDKLSMLPYTLYKKVAGEAESRTVQKRIGLTAEERRNSLFTDDMYKDVAKEDLIFLQEGLENSIAESRKHSPRHTKNDVSAFHLSRSYYEVTNDIFKIQSERKYKREIQSHIKNLPSDTDRTNGLWYLSKDEKRAFKINTSVENFEENKGETSFGFEVVDWCDLEKLSSEQRKEVQDGINNRKGINSILSRIEYERDTAISGIGTANNQTAAANNVGLDLRTLSGESIGRRTFGNSENNQQAREVEDELQMFIGKKARTQFEQTLRKTRPDMSDEEIQSTLDFLHSLEDNKENTAYIKTAIRWVANSSITLPRDNTKVRQIFDIARKKNLDLQKYRTFGELVTAPEMQPKEKERKDFDPDKARTFSNKHTVTTEGGKVFTVYDVEDTPEGQREVCKAVAAHYETSPWCLSTFTATGEPTDSAERYWKHYNGVSRKIAYLNGKPVAFSSDTSTTVRDEDGNTIEDLEDQLDYVLDPPTKSSVFATDPEIRLREIETLKNKIKELKSRQEAENKDREAWWDLEDAFPRNKLSDFMVTHPVDKRTYAQIAEDLGLSGTDGAIVAISDLMRNGVELTRENVLVQIERNRLNQELNQELNQASIREQLEEIYGMPADMLQMFVKRTSVNNSLSLQEKNNIRTLLKTINRTGTTLLDGGNGTIYLLDHTDKEGIEDRNPKTQDGFNCRLKFSTEGLTDEDLKTIKKAIEDGTIRDQISFDKWAKSNIGKQRGDNSDSLDAKERATNANNDRLDLQTSEGESGRGQGYQNSSNNLGGDFIRVAANDGTNGPRYIPINHGASAVEDYFMTPQGEIYGFVSKNGDIYLDENIITPEHPIHEFTHFWDRIVKQKNSRLWQRGVEKWYRTATKKSAS